MIRARARGRWRATARTFLVGLLAALGAACSRTPRVTLPSAAGTPFPDSTAAYEQAVRDCRSVKTMTASLSLSGRAGTSKLSARIDAGFAAEPARLRLEGFPKIHFGGKPFFILVARGAEATLLLTRDGRVLRGASPSAIIEALAGVALDPDDMRTLVSGCGLGQGQPSDGRSFDHGWASIRAGEATVFLRQIDNQWRVAGARRGSLSVEYSNFSGGRPAVAHVRTTASPGVLPADLTIRFSDLEANVALENPVFTVDVPRDAVPLTIEELRKAGPLGGSTESGSLRPRHSPV